MLAAKLSHRHTALSLAQDRKNLGFAISGHLHLNLLVHLAEKILLPQPLTFGGDYPGVQLLVPGLPDLVREHPGHTLSRLTFPRAHLCRVELALGRNLLSVLSPHSASSVTAALNGSEKFRHFVIPVSSRSGWIHRSTLFKFTGPLHVVY
jgi:hypothetical protein